MEKLQKTNLIFEEYEQRFAKARVDQKFRELWTDADREEVLKHLKDILCYDESLVPEIKIIDETHKQVGDIKVTHYTFESWKNVYGKFTLFSPNLEGKRPLIVICSGHEPLGCLAEANQKLAYHLANMGCHVVINQNLGQGSRAFLGHKEVLKPFYCGLTFQALIVAETIAVIRHAIKFDFVDTEKVGATGNSGGGTLTMLLSALAPEVKAVATTGYPSEFDHLFQKERFHCACNLFKGVMGKIDMWEVMALHAPNPLMMEQGLNDHLIPLDCFYRAARKVQTTYKMMGKGENFSYKTTPSGHSWVESDRVVIGQFFAKYFGLEEKDISETSNLMFPIEDGEILFPNNAITVDQLAEQLTGIKVSASVKELHHIYKPTYQGKYISRDEVVDNIGRGDLMRVWAQYEMVLSKD